MGELIICLLKAPTQWALIQSSVSVGIPWEILFSVLTGFGQLWECTLRAIALISSSLGVLLILPLKGGVEFSDVVLFCGFWAGFV